jgi:hypothetical protein
MEVDAEQRLLGKLNLQNPISRLSPTVPNQEVVES